RRRTQASNFQRLRDPLDYPLALAAGWLRHALRRHASLADPSPYRFPNWKLPILQLCVELVDADARRTQIGVVARHAIFPEEWRHHLVERSFERLLGAASGLRQQETSCHRNPAEGEQTESKR